MAFWLLKTEPGDYDWDRLAADGRTAWEGVRNHQAANNLRAMKPGERAFFYRSVKAPAVVGVMEVARSAYPDPADSEGRWPLVDFAPVAALPEPVPLAAIRAEPALEGLALIRQSRLSVMPVAAEHWRVIARMGGLKDDA